MILKEWIDKNGISQNHFGKLVGLTPGGISRIVNLQRFPNGDNLYKILEATNGEIQPNDLFEDYFLNKNPNLTINWKLR